MTRRTIVILVGLAVLGAAAAAVVTRRGPAPVDVDVGAVARIDSFRSTVTASGEIVATRYADIGSSVMGKIVSLPVAEADRVKAGQILARIDAVQAQSELASATEQARALQADEQAVGRSAPRRRGRCGRRRGPRQRCRPEAGPDERIWRPTGCCQPPSSTPQSRRQPP